MPACGKEEFLKVAQSRGFAVVRMGDTVREEAVKSRVNIKDPDLGNFADSERRKHGFGIWAQRTIPRISSKLNLIDGIRGYAEVEVYRGAYSTAVRIVAVHASPAIRLERAMKRKRQDDTANEHDFEARDRRELSWGLGTVIALADHLIVNERGLEDFRKEATAVLDKILAGR